MGKQAKPGHEVHDAKDAICGSFMDRHLEGWAHLHDMVLTRLNFVNRGGEWMLVVKAVAHEQLDVVAFITGESMASCVRRFGALLQQGNVKWKDDKPYGA